MKRVGKNSIAVGLATLLISVALSFSAQGAPTYKSYAEAQFIAATDDGLGQIVDPLGDAVENGGSNACEPTETDCDDEEYTSSPLQPLNGLTVPAGDALGGEIGPVSNYAKAKDGSSRAASGAVRSDGIVNVGGGGTAEPAATLDLIGDSADGIADVKLTAQAISAEADLKSPDFTAPTWANGGLDYTIEDLILTLDVPVLKTVSDGIKDETTKALGDIDQISLNDVCGTLDVVLKALCDALPADALRLTVPTVNELTDGLADNTDDGVDINLDTGDVSVDIEKILQAEGLDLNNLPPNTNLLPYITAALDTAIEGIANLLGDTSDGLVTQIAGETSLSVGGTVALPAGTLSTLTTPILAGLTDGLNTLGTVLADGLPDVVGPDALGGLAELRVNIPDIYKDLVASRAGVTAAAAETVYSETALQVKLAGGALADLYLGNALVGPNGPNGVADDNDTQADSDSQADNVNDNDSQADGNDAQSDGSDEDSDEDSDNDSDAQADADNDRDADAAADADVTSTLPNTGAPNILPLLLLALGLIVFGSAVLINERRRLNQL